MRTWPFILAKKRQGAHPPYANIYIWGSCVFGIGGFYLTEVVYICHTHTMGGWATNVSYVVFLQFSNLWWMNVLSNQNCTFMKLNWMSTWRGRRTTGLHLEVKWCVCRNSAKNTWMMSMSSPQDMCVLITQRVIHTYVKTKLQNTVSCTFQLMLNLHSNVWVWPAKIDRHLQKKSNCDVLL